MNEKQSRTTSSTSTSKNNNNNKSHTPLNSRFSTRPMTAVASLSRHGVDQNLSYTPSYSGATTSGGHSARQKERKEQQQEQQERYQGELLRHLLAMGIRRTGLQDKTHYIRPPYEFRHSQNLNDSTGLDRGKRLYLNDLCYTYSVKPMKTLKQAQFLSLLQKRRAVGKEKKFSKFFF